MLGEMRSNQHKFALRKEQCLNIQISRSTSTKYVDVQMERPSRKRTDVKVKQLYWLMWRKSESSPENKTLYKSNLEIYIIELLTLEIALNCYYFFHVVATTHSTNKNNDLKSEENKCNFDGKGDDSLRIPEELKHVLWDVRK